MTETDITRGISRDALAALLERHNLGALETVEVMRGGTVNPTLHVNQGLTLRFNLRDPDLPKLRWEALVYGRLRQETDVPCPEVIALDTTRDIVPCDVLFLRFVEGISGETIWPKLDQEAQDQISEDLGRLCATAHNLHWTTFGEWMEEDPRFVHSARWTDIVNSKLQRAYEPALRLNLLPPPLFDGLITTLNDADALYAEASAPTLTHTDLWLGNVILQQHGTRWKIAAMIDWEWSFIADAAWEFATLWRDSDPWPLPGSFIYGYKDRRTPPPDLRIRQRLYRLLDHFVRATVCAQRYGVQHEQTQLYVAAVRRMLMTHVLDCRMEIAIGTNM